MLPLSKKAIEAVQTENISIRMASAKFGIPKSEHATSVTSNKGHSFETQHILYFIERLSSFGGYFVWNVVLSLDLFRSVLYCVLLHDT